MSDSEGGTFDHEEDLMPLPLPELGETLRKYMESVKPFLTEQEMEHTTAVVKDFQEGIGRQLHEQLAARASQEKNWLEEWWETFAYMRPRYPAPINVNWTGVLPGSWGRRVSQTEAAASIAHGVAQFMLALRRGTLPAERMGGQKMSMHQFQRMFGSCRVPYEGLDAIEVAADAGTRHMMVLRRNAIFAVDVLDEAGEILPAATIQASLEQVMDATSALFGLGQEPPLSVLTTENRDAWAKAREHLLAVDPANEASMGVVESALFALVLSEDSPADTDEILRHALHGDGRNKWFDKPFNFVVHANGRMGLNGEHSWADAIAVVSCFAFVLDRIRDGSDPSRQTRPEGATSPAPIASAVGARKLEWVIDDETRGSIERASTAFVKMCKTVDLRSMVFHHFGKAFIKRYRIVPDMFVQMAIQLAYSRLHSKPAAVYESGHTRLYYHGRTETIRSCSLQSIAFCRAMNDASMSPGDRWKALQEAVAKQRERTKDALLGQGIDRHLLGLYILSELAGTSPRPAFFTDKAYVESSKFLLSTSNIGSTPVWGGFMAMYTDGYGCCYGIEDDKINFCITANNDCADTSASRFRSAVEDALIDMQSLCLTRDVMYQAKAKM